MNLESVLNGAARTATVVEMAISHADADLTVGHTGLHAVEDLLESSVLAGAALRPLGCGAVDSLRERNSTGLAIRRFCAVVWVVLEARHVASSHFGPWPKDILRMRRRGQREFEE